MTARAFNSRPILLQVYLVLATIEALEALFHLASVPADAKNALILGYSPIRLALLGGMGMVFLGGCVLLILLLSKQAMEAAVEAVSRALTDRTIRAWVTQASFLIAACGVVVFLIPADRLKGAVYIVERLIPVIFFAICLSVQTLIAQFIWRGGKLYWENITSWARPFKIFLFVSACIAAITGWVLWSRIGLDPDRSGWYAPGTPLLFSQVIFSWIVGTSLIYWEKPLGQLVSRMKFRKIQLTLDAALCMSLWLVAALLWWVQPMSRWSYFTSAPTPPNFEYYPYSDAAIYDGASQGLLIGISRNTDVMLRPLYTFFLALLHALGGQNYAAIVLLQILVLAMAPGLVYLIGSRLSSRPAGILAALLVILRERNSIALTNIIEVSHTKLLLSDVPAMVLMLLLVYLLIVWLQVPGTQGYRGVIAGAALGLVVLVRSQAQLLVPVLLVILILVERFQWRTILQRFALFIAGLLLVIIPWIGRNYLVSGTAAVENPEFYVRILASGYVHTQDDIEMLSGESSPEYYDRMREQIVQFIIDQPAEVARFYGAHFVHNEIGSVIYLPLTLRFPSLYSYIRELMLWKEPWRNVSAGPFFMLVLNLSIISVGIAAAFWRARWIGLIPLLIHLGYSLSVVPMRLSGWRFILPVDWASVLYYAIGLTMLSAVLRSAFVRRDQSTTSGNGGGSDETEPALSGNPATDHKMIPLALIISLLLGALMPLLEIVMPVRYPYLSHDQIIRRYVSGSISLSDGSTLTGSDLSSFLKTQNGSMIAYGRALYPGYYEMGKFWGDQNASLMAASAYDRLQFQLIGPLRAFVFLPLGKPPDFFPQAADVLVIGCVAPHGTQALLIKIAGREDWLMTSPWHGLKCSGSQ